MPDLSPGLLDPPPVAQENAEAARDNKTSTEPRIMRGALSLSIRVDGNKLLATALY
jgi:hypothetical protein